MRAELAKSLKLPETQPAMTQHVEGPDIIRGMQAGNDDAIRDLHTLYGQRCIIYSHSK